MFGRIGPWVESGRGQTFCRQSRVGSGQRFARSGRVGPKKSDPRTTLRCVADKVLQHGLCIMWSALSTERASLLSLALISLISCDIL